MTLKLLPNQPKRISTRALPTLIWHREVTTTNAPLPMFLSVYRNADGSAFLQIKIGNKHGRETRFKDTEFGDLTLALEAAGRHLIR